MISEAFLFWVKNHNKRNHAISNVYFGEGWLWILLEYYLLRLPWKGCWGDRRIRRNGLRCNSCSRRLGKQFALSPVSPFFKSLHRLTSIKKLTLAHATKKILQSNWGKSIQAGRPCGVVDDVAFFQVYKPLLKCEDLGIEFQFLVLNVYNEGNLGSGTLTCSSLIPLPKVTSKYIRQFPPYSMLGYSNKL